MAVPIQIVCGSAGSIEIAEIDRSRATAALPGSRAQWAPPSVDRNRPTPASESDEPLGSPVPAYRVLPDGSLGSTTIDPMALEVRPVSTGCQSGWVARASFVLQMPPPAAPTHRRHEPVGLQFGSMAIAVTRPEVVVSRPVYVVTAGTRGSTGPSADQAPASAARWPASAMPRRKSAVGTVWGSASKARRPETARLDST